MTVGNIIVTGAAGQTGQSVLNYLKEYMNIGKQEKQQGTAATTSKRPKILAAIKPDDTYQHKTVTSLGFEPLAINFNDPQTLTQSFKNCDLLFIIPSASVDKQTHGINCIKAAKEAGVKSVVLLSMMKCDYKLFLHGKQFWMMEEELKNSGIEQWCIIRANFYAQNLLLYKDMIKAGRLPLPTGNGKFAPLDCDDIGCFFAKIMKIGWESGKFTGKTFNLTGPVSMNGDDMANSFSAVLSETSGKNKPVKFENISLKQAKEILLDQSVPPHEIQGLAEFYELVADGKVDMVSKDFEEIVGELPTSLNDFLKKRMADLQ